MSNYVQIRMLNKQNFDHLSHLKNYKPWYTVFCDKLARFQEHVLEAIWNKKCLTTRRPIWLHYWVRQALTFTVLCDCVVNRYVCLCSKLALLLNLQHATFVEVHIHNVILLSISLLQVSCVHLPFILFLACYCREVNFKKQRETIINRLSLLF